MIVLVVVEILLTVISIAGAYLHLKNEGIIFRKNLVKYCILGAIICVLTGIFVCKMKSIEQITMFALMGVLAPILLAIFYLAAKQMWIRREPPIYYDDGTPIKFFITGDKHRDFSRVKQFCYDMQTRKKDVMIVLGDSGFNYYEDERDDALKAEMSSVRITLFCLHGNKENRPENIDTYGVKTFCGGKVYYEPKYPNILFAIDGEIYTFDGKKYMVVGGAHSVDKNKCLQENLPFWFDEMPSDEIKDKVEERLADEDNTIYGMLTHTCPFCFLPTEMFVSTRQNASLKRKHRKSDVKKMFKPDIDRSTEKWLDRLETVIDYQVWFCGHYHIDKQIDKVTMLYNEIRPLHLQLFEEEQWME